MRILLIEPDSHPGKSLTNSLGRQCYLVDWVTSIEKAQNALKRCLYDLVLLEPSHQKQCGIAFLENMRAEQNTIPVIILSNNINTADKIMYLNGGADAYLQKPISHDELFAHLEAVHRRSQERINNVVCHGDLVLDLSARTVNQHGLVITLSAMEFAILRILLTNRGHIFSKSSLERRVHRGNSEIESNTVEVHISHLRKKIGKDLIVTIRGMGYVIYKPAENRDDYLKRLSA